MVIVIGSVNSVSRYFTAASTSVVKPVGADVTLESQLMAMLKAVGEAGSVGRLEVVDVIVVVLFVPPTAFCTRDAPSSEEPNAYSVWSSPAPGPAYTPSSVHQDVQPLSLESHEPGALKFRIIRS